MTIQSQIILPRIQCPARDQGARPTCIAFALSELNLVAATHVTDLSPEYLYQLAAQHTPTWKPRVGVPLNVAVMAANKGQPVESDYPYQDQEPPEPIPPLPTPLDLHGTRIKASLPDKSRIIDALQQNKPVGLCINLTRSFFSPENGVVADEPIPMKDVLHAVTVVGMGNKGSEQYFLIRNSWGVDWGINGHAWLSAGYVQSHTLWFLEA